jgi:hypothetical protein
MWRVGLFLLTAALACADPGAAQPPPVQVTFRDEQPVVAETTAALDPVRRINYQPSGLGAAVRTETNQTLHLGHAPTVKVDDMINPGPRVEYANRALPAGKGGKVREGFESAYIYGDLRVTCTVSVVPTRPVARGAKRRRDAVLIHYVIENKGQRPHTFGLRVYMDTYVIDNDGALFAAPTIPGQILDGRVLKGKELPPYLQILQRPDLKNPGFVAHMTFDLGSRIDRPDRIVLTRFGAGGGAWDMPVFQAMGDSAMGVFWEPKAIKPGGKREIAYAYGQGIATSPENEGRVQLALGGSFEPGKRFDLTAYVTDPAPGQSLTLELPEGMALVEGKASQPVPEAPGDEASSLVRWRARVLRPGHYAVRVRSSTGVTQGKLITITRPGG